MISLSFLIFIDHQQAWTGAGTPTPVFLLSYTKC